MTGTLGHPKAEDTEALALPECLKSDNQVYPCYAEAMLFESNAVREQCYSGAMLLGSNATREQCYSGAGIPLLLPTLSSLTAISPAFLEPYELLDHP